MFPDLEFVKTALNGIADRFRRVDQYYHEIKNEVTSVKNNKIDKKQNAENAGKFLGIDSDGVVKPDEIVVPKRHVVLLTYNSSTKTYSISESYSIMKKWIDAGDTVVLSLQGTIYNLFEEFSSGTLTFVYAMSYDDGQVKVYSVSVYDSGSLSFVAKAGYFLPNNNNTTFAGLIPVATKNYRYELTDLSNVVIKSSTKGSTKKFKLSVDDSGAISTTEVTA